MLKFFRKIRRSLLEQKKSGVYLRYALGEIFLVVIGILIALSINNWNEERKEKATTRVYIENLKSDIFQDSTVLNFLIETGDRHQKIIGEFKSYLVDSDHTLSEKVDSSLKLQVYFYRYLPFNQTYLDMQSSGSSKLLNQEQRSILNKLTGMQSIIVNTNQTFISWAIGELANRNQYIDEYRLVSKVTGQSSTPEELKLFLRHQLNYLYRMENMGRTLSRFAKDAKEFSKEAILKLEEEL